jgi:hypothetical protein
MKLIIQSLSSISAKRVKIFGTERNEQIRKKSENSSNYDLGKCRFSVFTNQLGAEVAKLSQIQRVKE